LTVLKRNGYGSDLSQDIAMMGDVQRMMLNDRRRHFVKWCA